jgi:hypothetical protein
MIWSPDSMFVNEMFWEKICMIECIGDIPNRIGSYVGQCRNV